MPLDSSVTYVTDNQALVQRNPTSTLDPGQWGMVLRVTWENQSVEQAFRLTVPDSDSDAFVLERIFSIELP